MNKISSQKLEVILLGAGPTFRAEFHSALIETKDGSRVIDWLLQAYAEYESNLQLVVGYNLNEIQFQYPNVTHVQNENWEKTGAIGSLFCADIFEEKDLFISYCDILYRKTLIQEMLVTDGDLVVAIDSQWKDRYAKRSTEDLEKSEKVNISKDGITKLGQDILASNADAEFIGLIKLNGQAIDLVNSFKSQSDPYLKKAKLSYLVEQMRVKGLSVKFVDVVGDWAEMDDPRDLAHFVLGTKAQTLERLSDLVTESIILDQYTFDVGTWIKDSRKVVSEIMETFPNGRIVARSSALTEDGFGSANAGKYDSVLNINSSKFEAVESAIMEVIASYPDRDPNNQVLVQPMVKDVKVSGVGFTRTLNHGAPYYVVNYDDQTGSTESITSGTSTSDKTIIVRRDKIEKLSGPPKPIIQLLIAFREIEGFVNYDSLDIEFAIDSNGKVYILQVRPIAVDHSDWDVDDKDLFDFIKTAENKYHQFNKETAVVQGSSAVYGIMPDWNPAEIIGVNPGRLAVSLYKEIIMNNVWSTQRYEYGYRDTRPVPLLVTFSGHPYVDVRASFNSFIPSSISDDLAKRLVDSYLEHLIDHPQFHDKVEFDVVPTCFDLNFEKWKDRLGDKGFNQSDIEELRLALLEITNNAIVQNENYFEQVNKLELRFEDIEKNDLDPLIRAYYLLEDCKRYGTLPFAHLARSAFVAVSLLRSAVEMGCISEKAKDDFLSTIHTVSHEFTEDVQCLANKVITMDSFLDKYGHIRPGTYDITSKSYKEAPDYYITPLLKNNEPAKKADHKSGSIWEAEKNKFADACKEEGIEHDFQAIESFLRGAIEGREYAKFVFSRNLSAAIQEMLAYGKTKGLNREQISHISWQELFATRELGSDGSTISDHLKSIAENGASWNRIGSVVELPPLITGPEDFWWFFLPESQPNYVGTGQITADCVEVSDDLPEGFSLEGKIVLIPRADPGYEWLFGRKIGGLITMYGGANSHMAIRAAEFNLPAAIGVGEKEYVRIGGAKRLTINAANRKIDILQ